MLQSYGKIAAAVKNYNSSHNAKTNASIAAMYILYLKFFTSSGLV